MSGIRLHAPNTELPEGSRSADCGVRQLISQSCGERYRRSESAK